MRFSKVELKKQLRELGVTIVEGNYVKKSDIKKFLIKGEEIKDDVEFRQVWESANQNVKNAEKLFEKLSKIRESYGNPLTDEEKEYWKNVIHNAQEALKKVKQK